MDNAALIEAMRSKARDHENRAEAMRRAGERGVARTLRSAAFALHSAVLAIEEAAERCAAVEAEAL